MKRIKDFLKKYLLFEEIVAAFLLTAIMMYYFGETFSKQYLIALLVFVALFVLIKKGVGAFSKRRMKYALFFAVPLGVAMTFGRKLDINAIEFPSFNILSIPLAIALIIIIALMCLCAFSFIDKKTIVLKAKAKPIKKRWLFYSLLIFVVYLPLFLSFFPGLVSVDSAVQIRQAIGETGWSNWHPVISTAFMALPITIGFNLFGDLTAGIALATLTQMMVLALIFGYTVEWIMSRVSRRWIGYLFLGFFALCPVISCYSITLWKDILFSALFMLLVIKVYELIMTTGRKEKIVLRKIIGIFILAILVAFFRNGGVLILLALAVAMYVFFKKNRRMIAVISMASIILIVVVQGPVYGLFNITSSPFMESMSIPAQQIGYVAANGGLTEDEKKSLSSFADVEKLTENYTATNADPAKKSFNYDSVDEDKMGFLKVWFDIMKSHFGAYVEAYILQTYSYWYPQGESWVLDFDEVHDPMWLKQEYKNVALLGEPIKNGLRNVELGLTRSSWFGWATSVGVLCWGMILMVIIFIYQKKYYMLLPLSGVIIYILSLLVASPVSWIFRYVYSLLLIMPFLILCSFVKIKGKDEK